MLENKYKMDFLSKNVARIGQSDESFTVNLYDKKYTKHPRLLHYHDFYELEFVLDGEAANYINGMKFDLYRGMMFMTRPTDIHRYEIKFENHLRVYTIRFTSGILCVDLISELARSELLVADFSGQYDFVRALIDDARSEYEKPDGYSKILYVDTAARLSVMLLRAANTIKKRITLSAENRIAAIAASYINTGFGSHITIRTAAEKIGVSPNYLGRLFSENMNMTFGQYLKRVRLICAMNRVANTDDTLQGIAFDCGFSSQSVFTREFKIYYGKSPVCFRKGGEPDNNNEVKQ